MSEIEEIEKAAAYVAWVGREFDRLYSEYSPVSGKTGWDLIRACGEPELPKVKAYRAARNYAQGAM